MEKIMRRGLSPEGRLIRDRHQSSIFHNEYGVTATHIINKKIDKEGLHENLLRLREIQAKSRNLESRRSSACQPIKAFQHPVSLVFDKKEKPQTDKSSPMQRVGSPNSDYFSMSDEAQNIVHNDLLPLNSNLNKHEFESNFLTEVKPLNLTSVRSKSSAGVQENGHKTDVLFDLSPKQLDNQNNLTSKYATVYPCASVLKANRMSNIIDKIKSKKPACDTNIDNIWKDIEKHHHTFLPPNVFVSKLNTARMDSQKAEPLQPKVASPFIRSRSLDRRTPRFKSNQSFILQNGLEKTFTRIPDQTHVGSKEVCNQYSIPKSVKNSLFCNTTAVPSINRFTEQHTSPVLTMQNFNHAENTGSNNRLSEDEKDIFDLNNSLINEKSEKEKLDMDGYNNYNCAINQKFSGETVHSLTPANLVRSKSANDMRMRQLSPLPTFKRREVPPKRGEIPFDYKRGEVPRYLRMRREAEARREKEALAVAESGCPPGQTLVPDEERTSTLQQLKKGEADLLGELTSLPLAVDTLGLRRRRGQIEDKLRQIEEGIAIFSQAKVYVVDEQQNEG